jgi:hypothetical protein
MVEVDGGSMTQIDNAMALFQKTVEDAGVKMQSEVAFGQDATARATAAVAGFDAARTDVKVHFDAQMRSFAQFRQISSHRAASARTLAQKLVWSGFEQHHVLRMMGLKIKLKLLEILVVIVVGVSVVAALALFALLLGLVLRFSGGR